MNDNDLARVLAKIESDNYANFLRTRIAESEKDARAVAAVDEHMLNFN